MYVCECACCLLRSTCSFVCSGELFKGKHAAVFLREGLLGVLVGGGVGLLVGGGGGGGGVFVCM